MVPPNPPLEGKFVDYSFDAETSGLFGKELGGEWMDYDLLTFQYLLYFHEYRGRTWNHLIRLLNKHMKLGLKENRIFSKYSWYDVHATF